MEIRLKDVVVKNNHKYLLDKLNLTIKGPKIIGLMGNKKSLILEVIDLIQKPVYGSIRFNDDEVTEENILKYRKVVSFISQETKDQFFLESIQDEMRFLVENLEYKHSNIDKKMCDSLRLVGLNSDYLNKSFMELSSGEKKLVQLAVGLIYNPKVILLDEPLANLDYINQRKLINLLRLLKDKYGKTIIIASNDSDFLYEVAEEIIITHNGNVVSQDTALNVMKNIEVLDKYSISHSDLVDFTLKAKNKKVKLSYHTDIRDLIKDVYKHV